MAGLQSWLQTSAELAPDRPQHPEGEDAELAAEISWIISVKCGKTKDWIESFIRNEKIIVTRFENFTKTRFKLKLIAIVLQF